MKTATIGTQGSLQPSKRRKAYRGAAMEGFIAKWYSRNQLKSIDQYRSWAKMASGHAPEGAEVLEVAPGPGYLSVELAKLNNYRVVGLDISRTFVDIATEKAKAANVHVEFRLGDAAYMPFPDSSFDFVICTAAFKNFPEPTRVLDEIFRVLRSGAEAVIVDLSKDATRTEINEYVEQMKLSRINNLITKFTFRRLLLRWAYTKAQIQDLASRSRFGACEIIDEGIGFELWLRRQ